MSTVIDNKTLPKIAPDEPIFVLRAQDCLAPKCIRDWAARALMAGTPREKVLDAIKIAEAMDNWPAKKVPD